MRCGARGGADTASSVRSAMFIAAGAQRSAKLQRSGMGLCLGGLPLGLLALLGVAAHGSALLRKESRKQKVEIRNGKWGESRNGCLRSALFNFRWSFRLFISSFSRSPSAFIGAGLY